MVKSKLQEKIKGLPASPGVYIFRDENGGILYIGKATNLRERVRSYFRTDANLRNESESTKYDARPIHSVIDQIADVEVRQTDSVLEALILEANLIKKFQPKYNVEGKDDKSFSYAVITKEEFPRVLILRETELESRNSERITHNENHTKKSKKISGVLSSTFHVSRTFGPYTSKKSLETALKIMRKIFPFHSSKQKTEKGCLEHQIGLCPGPYTQEISRKDYLKNIRGIKMILEGKKKSLIKKLEKEMQEYSKNQEFEKAGEIRNKIFALRHIQDVALISGENSHSIISTSPHLTRAGKPAHPLLIKEREIGMRMEAYDISNISGQYATGSMVVFENNEPNKNEYRKFRIKTVRGANDVGMMKEVLLRRFQNNWPKPDLILLDGGVGHLNMGEAVLEGLGLEISIAAIAKGKERKKQEVKSKQNIENIIDKKTLKRIMDEAHRFAIGYHRKLRGKNYQ